MRIIFALILILTWNVTAQVGTGQWRLHVPSNKAIDVVAENNVVYTAFEAGLMEYDIASSETSLWTDVNGLSDVSLTCLGYDKIHNALYIGYENGNIDVLQNNRITNVPAIRLAQVSGVKRINKIVSFDKYLYFATSFSVVKFDPVKMEVRDTYYPTNGNQPIIDVSFQNDTIFALTNSKLFKGYINNVSLADSSQWSIDSRVPVLTSNGYSDLESVDNQLYISYVYPEYGKDTVYCIKNGRMERVTDPTMNLEVYSLQNIDGKLGVNIDLAVYTYNSDYSMASNMSMNDVSVNESYYNNGIIWIANKRGGLAKYQNGGSTKIEIQGPPKDQFYSVDCNKGKLVVAGGGINGHAMTFNSAGIYSFSDEKWSLMDRYNSTLWKDKNIWDFITVAIDPTNVDRIAMGTFSQVPLSISEDGQHPTEIFTIDNSPIQSSMWNVESIVSELTYDNKGNLWIANSYCSDPLKVYTKDKKWQTISLGNNLVEKSINKIEIDYDGNKWLAVPSVGLVAFNDNNTIEILTDDKVKILNSGENTGALPSNEVTSIAVDLDNQIWIGTESGFAILYSPSSVFEATPGSYNAQRIKLKFEGENEYLLGKTYISDIEVDGGNRKWFGTANAGIFLLSSDGTEIIQNFTTDNSPLISNVILDMAFDHSTGELFIVTDKGLISYRSDASAGQADYSNVQVFPNPARLDETEWITIQGIKYDSDINVTDVAGNLVFKTTSNGGTATWNGKTVQGEKVKPGVYLFWTAPNDGKGRKVGKVVVMN